MNLELLKQELRRDEDERFDLYRCSAGKLTIGIGRNIEDRGISPDESALMFKNDIDIVQHEIKRALPMFATFTEARQRALANAFFALGMTKFMGFKNMISATKEGRWDAAADELLDSVWARTVGQRANRLAIMLRNGY